MKTRNVVLCLRMNFFELRCDHGGQKRARLRFALCPKSHAYHRQGAEPAENAQWRSRSVVETSKMMSDSASAAVMLPSLLLNRFGISERINIPLQRIGKNLRRRFAAALLPRTTSQVTPQGRDR